LGGGEFVGKFCSLTEKEIRERKSHLLTSGKEKEAPTGMNSRTHVPKKRGATEEPSYKPQNSWEQK